MIKRKLSKLFKFLFLDVVIDMMIFLVVFAYSLSHRGHGFHHIAGLIVALVGLGFRILSRIHLGDSFSVKSEAKKLVTSGMYSKIRNPIYIFSLLAFTGVIRSLGEPEYFLILLIFLFMEMIRATKEKNVLHEKFGEEYKQYRKKTWF